MDLASVVAALASVGVRVSGSNPNNNIQGDSSRACPTGLAGPEPSGTHIDPGQHFQGVSRTYTGSRDPEIAAIGTFRQEECCGRFEPSFPRSPGTAKGVIGPFSCRPALGTPR